MRAERHHHLGCGVVTVSRSHVPLSDLSVAGDGYLARHDGSRHALLAQGELLKRLERASHCAFSILRRAVRYVRCSLGGARVYDPDVTAELEGDDSARRPGV